MMLMYAVGVLSFLTGIGVNVMVAQGHRPDTNVDLMYFVISGVFFCASYLAELAAYERNKH